MSILLSIPVYRRGPGEACPCVSCKGAMQQDPWAQGSQSCQLAGPKQRGNQRWTARPVLIAVRTAGPSLLWNSYLAAEDGRAKPPVQFSSGSCEDGGAKPPVQFFSGDCEDGMAKPPVQSMSVNEDGRANSLALGISEDDRGKAKQSTVETGRAVSDFSSDIMVMGSLGAVVGLSDSTIMAGPGAGMMAGTHKSDSNNHWAQSGLPRRLSVLSNILFIHCFSAFGSCMCASISSIFDLNVCNCWLVVKELITDVGDWDLPHCAYADCLGRLPMGNTTDLEQVVAEDDSCTLPPGFMCCHRFMCGCSCFTLFLFQHLSQTKLAFRVHCQIHHQWPDEGSLPSNLVVDCCALLIGHHLIHC